jgi:hypothetical protein
MIDLVWKDIVVARWILVFLIPLYALQLGVMASQALVFLFLTLLFTGLLAFGPIGLEDHQNTECLWCSLPITRREVVLARYLSTGLGLLLGLALSWLIGRVAAPQVVVGAGRDAAPSPGLLAYAGLAVLLAFLAAAFLPCYFRFGAGRGLVVFSAIGVGALIVTPLVLQLTLFLAGYTNPLLDPELWRRGAEKIGADEGARFVQRVIGGLGALASGAVLVSAGLSVHFYEKRDL